MVMKISVVMAAYNSEATIGRSIESFLSQSHPKKELIVVDGASQDNTCAIVKQFDSPLIRISSAPDLGIYDAMNKGLRQVKGDAFGCLNSDDCYTSSNVLALIAEALDSVDIVSGGLHFVREHDGSPPVRVWLPEPYRAGAFKKGFSLPHPSTYARRVVLDRVGEFSTNYAIASDYDWLLRALELEGFSHAATEEILVNMRIGGASTGGARAIWTNSRELLKIRRERLNSGLIDIALFRNLIIKIRQQYARFSRSESD